MKDLIDQIAAARRTVGTGTLPAGAAHTITLRRTYAAAIDDVWDAITDPERIVRWFLPVSGDLREGGTYALTGNASGEIRVCRPPRHLSVTWIGPGSEPSELDDSIVHVRLSAIDDDTTDLELEHIAVPPEEFWDTFGPGAVGVGWDLTLVGLDAHLAGVAIGSPEEMDADPNVRAAMTASAAAWGAAHIASGVAADVAGAAAAATTAFYVPPAEDPPSLDGPSEDGPSST